MPGPWDETPDIQGKRHADREIALLADRQHGVVALRQLEALGLAGEQSSSGSRSVGFIASIAGYMRSAAPH